MVESSKVVEIRGAENVQKWTLGKKADTSHIIFKDSEGEEIDSPYEEEEAA